MKLKSLFRPSIFKAMATGVGDALLQSSLIPDEGRPKLLKARGATVGSACTLSAGLQASTPKSISIGRGCYMNKGCILQGEGGIEIGEQVFFGRNVAIITIDHEIGKAEKRAGPKDVKPVRIGRGSWLASNVTVLPGVTIGEGTVVGAGAVVTRDLPGNALYAGVPAKKLRDLPI